MKLFLIEIFCKIFLFLLRQSRASVRPVSRLSPVLLQITCSSVREAAQPRQAGNSTTTTTSSTNNIMTDFSRSTPAPSQYQCNK